jgi:hypothetical protein
MTRWKYLQVHVHRNDYGWVDYVHANGKLIFDYDSENKDKKRGEKKRDFNFADYFDIVGKDGWELVTAHSRDHSSDVYMFKQIILE